MAKVLVRKGKKQFLEDLGREVNVIKQRIYYVSDLKKEFSTEHGSISKNDLKKNGSVLSSLKKDFILFDNQLDDQYVTNNHKKCQQGKYHVVKQ